MADIDRARYHSELENNELNEFDQKHSQNLRHVKTIKDLKFSYLQVAELSHFV